MNLLKNLFSSILESDDPAVKVIKMDDLTIAIECEKGKKRDPKAEYPITADYGYIMHTIDPDEGDSVDVYVGPDHESRLVVRLKQLDKQFKFDEFKWMLGFNSKEEAMKCYIDSKPPFFHFGGADVIIWEEFKEYLKDNRR